MFGALTGHVTVESEHVGNDEPTWADTWASMTRCSPGDCTL